MKLSAVCRKAFEENCFELIVNAYNQGIAEKKHQHNWIENDFPNYWDIM